MRRRRTNPLNVFSLSLLDVIFSSLGAFVILTVILIQQISKAESNIPKEAPPKTSVSAGAYKDCQDKYIKCVQAPCDTRCPCQEYCCNEDSCPCETYCKSEATLFGLPLKSKRAVFLVDVSGSMAGHAHRLKSTVSSLINACQMEAFRVIYFNSVVYDQGHWGHGWLKGSKANKTMALSEIRQKIDAFLVSGGSTNSVAGLMRSLSYGDVETIYFITDGNPDGGPAAIPNLLSQVAQTNRSRAKRAIINSIMVGVSADKVLYDFLHKLAEDNGGAYIGR
jgi:hypothetical protein